MTQPAAPPAPPAPPRVPADFEQAKIDRDTAGLTAEEVAEYRALRAEKKKRDEDAAEAARLAAAKLARPTHHVHLANGDVVEGSTIATRYAFEDGSTVPVTGAWALPPEPD